MLDTTELDLEQVWNLLKEIRKSFLSKSKQKTWKDHFCGPRDKLLLGDYITINVKSFAERLKLNTSDRQNRNVSYKTLETAGEMFTYLNYCPPELELFTTYILGNGSPKDMILALTHFMKTSQNSEKESTRRILLRVMEALDLHTYEKIQMVTKGKCYINNTFVKCTKNRNLSEEDIRLLGLSLLVSVVISIYFSNMSHNDC